MWMEQLFCFACGLVSAFAYCESAGCSQEPIVTTPNGRLRGSTFTSRLGKEFYAFRGIRYAKPPVDDLRFKPPVPYGSWNGVYNATKDMPFCPQPGFNNTSEDCLMINVYTTKLPEYGRNPKRPVIVFIHDGGFYVFSGNFNFRGPEYLIDQDVVLVTMNYRLFLLGFLSTADELAPGNNGMRDQVLALKWIQQNIEAFGGDKDRVTLLGYSAGSWSVILHMVSPMARGLFHSGVCMSGAPVGIRPLSDQSALSIAKETAASLGCPTESSKNMIDCLKAKSAEEIGSVATLVSPVIEQDFGQERYLPEHPIKLIVEGNFYKVPIVLGRNKDEFASSAYDIVNNETLTGNFNENFDKYAPIYLGYERDTEKSRRISEGIRQFYLVGKPISNDTVNGLGKAFADAVIGFEVDRAAKLIANNSDKPVYYYLTTYLGQISGFYLPGSNGTIPYGVVHEDEVIYMFFVRDFYPFFNDSYPTESRSVSRLTTLWANFARTGNPTPERSELFNNIHWEPYNLRTQKYLDLGAELKIKERLFETRYAFWERYYPISEYLN